ncbi:hypothetical protein HPB50_008269 [Hyalomma asiaticum]|uniref:Uncharacterized protein n=1 Tax=Hyalomma asiaticum TaxID=266040 RepID=A0ACB7RPW8_HYAAI|nr:hypothetical protein HPB50_008269 [Hyalomma asiaticum]
MSPLEIDKLCNMFYVLRFDELYALDDVEFAWLPPLRGLTLGPAVERIRCTLRCVQSVHVCLHYSAMLYSWLIPRGISSPWYLYRLDTALTQLDPAAIGLILTQAMESSSNAPIGDGVLDVRASLYLTLLIQDESRHVPEYRPVCFCMWRGLPFITLHAPGMSTREINHWPALASVLGDMDRNLHSLHDDLKSAHSTAVRIR